MKLNQLQLQFSEALLYKNDLIKDQIKEKKNFTRSELLQVYRNSFVMGVTEALAITYLHTQALVGEEFFNSVTRAFILQTPPAENNIITYGEGFSDFLNTLPQLKEMPYIAEMASFEWLLEQTSGKQITTKTLDIEKLSALQEDQFEQLLFQVPSQISLFSSEQDIFKLYKMLINNDLQETDLNHKCYLVLKKQLDFSVELIELSKDQFMLLQQISEDKSLAEIKPHDLHQFLPVLLEKELLNGFVIKQ